MTPEEIEREIQRAIELIDLGRNDQALETLRRLLASEPATASQVELLMSAAHLRAQRPQQAIKHAEASLRADPGQARSYVVLASGLQSLGRSSEAVEALQRGLSLDSTMVDAYALGAQALSDLNAHGDAENWARSALQLAPEDADAHFAMGYVLHDQRPAQAEEAYRATLSRDPEHMQAMQNLATLRVHRGDRRRGTQMLADVLSGTRGSRLTLTLLDTLTTHMTLRTHRLTFLGVLVTNMVVAVVSGNTRPNPWPGTIAGVCLLGLVGLAIWAINRNDLSALRESLPRQGAGFFRGYPRRNPIAMLWLVLIGLGWASLSIAAIAALIGAALGNPDAPYFLLPAGGITLGLLILGAILSWVQALLTRRRIKQTRQL